MKTTAQLKTTLSKGFTLIELLIVIAVLGVLAAATLAAIDPVDKINSGNDAKAISDIAQIARAAEAYAAANGGQYPTSIAQLVTSGELKSSPNAPTGYTYTWSGGGGAAFTVSSNLTSKKYQPAAGADRNVYRYQSANGTSCAAADATAACP